MAILKNNRLSSDFLYTYTSQLANIKLILKYGLRHSINKEYLPYNNSQQHNFIICFCDILPEQSEYHKSVYGNYAIALKKSWGIKNEITPIRYIHDKSTGASKEYSNIKNDIREARLTLQDGNQIDYFLSLILHSTSREKGLLTKDSIHQEMGNEELSKHINDIEQSFENKRKKIGDPDLNVIFNEWVIPIIHMLEKTVDELEKRDALLRIYEGDFREIKNKILYDEREWRSVKFIKEADNKINPSILKDAIKNQYLPEAFNLKFIISDIEAILVETEAEKIELKKFIIDELTHLKGAESLVFTFGEHITTN